MKSAKGTRCESIGAFLSLLPYKGPVVFKCPQEMMLCKLIIV